MPHFMTEEEHEDYWERQGYGATFTTGFDDDDVTVADTDDLKNRSADVVVLNSIVGYAQDEEEIVEAFRSDDPKATQTLPPVKDDEEEQPEKESWAERQAAKGDWLRDKQKDDDIQRGR